MKLETELMRGAGPAAVLSLLESGEKYGYELVSLLETRSGGTLAMGQSTLYPMLYNLEAQGFIESYWQESTQGRNRKYYRITGKGSERLAKDAEQYRRLHDALANLGVFERALLSLASSTKPQGAP
jgi:PadR family transcriptional regulator, regulatory protein PadR